jgi:acetyltransferase-like isoleucine patch superfamily enzyme
MNYFAHEKAIVESKKIGHGTRIWAFAHILPGARIGRECNICDHTFIENDVVIGNRVTVKCGVQLWDRVRLEDDVFIGPNVSFTNDSFPRSKKKPERFEKTVVCRGASIGANATILSNITVGRNAMVGAGSVVTRDVPPNAIVQGNPARIEGYVSAAAAAKEIKIPSVTIETIQKQKFKVKGIGLFEIPLIEDIRGKLSFGEYDKHLPFVPKRFFIIHDVPSKEVRGEHAHRKLHQGLICIKGTCSIVADDGISREEIVLDSPTVGLHIVPMVWTTQYKYSSDAMLLVLASDIYKAEDYIRSYEEFLVLTKRRRKI